MLKYIKHRQKLLEKKWEEEEKKRAEEAEEEAARVAKMEAEARHKIFLIERQEDERLRQKHIQRQEKLSEEKWDKHFDTLLAQIKDRLQKDNDDKLEEIRVIIRNREPSLQELDWDSWLSDPLNQQLADLDFDHAIEMFKRDNLLAKRRYRTRPHPPRGKKKYIYSDVNVLSFTGNTSADSAEDYVTTTFDPDDYNLNEGFTLSYWVRPDELGNTMFPLGRKPTSSQRFHFGIQSATQMFIGAGSKRIRTNAPHGMEVGRWYHWAITYAGNSSGRTLKVYKDGVLMELDAEGATEASATWSSTGGDSPIFFGGYKNTNVSGGKYTGGWACGLDEVAIFDTEKDSGWVTETYVSATNADLTGQSGLVGYWKFNEGSGTTVKDYSGNGNHGTFAAISGDTTAYPTWETR